MKQKSNFLLGMVIAVLWAVAGIPEAAYAATVKIGGSGFGLGVMKIAAEAFEKSRPGVKIVVIPSLGSAGGIKALNQGALDMAISGRPLNDAEKSKGAIVTELARSPFIVVVHKSVTKDGVSIQELEKIFSGQMLTWPEGSRIRLVLRPETDTYTRLARGLSPAMNQAMTLAMSRDGMIQVITDQESADVVEKTPGALAFATLTQIYSENRQVKILSFNGIRPDVKGVGKNSYPLYISLYLVTTPGITPAAREFADFLRSGEGSEILLKYGNLLVKDGKSEKQ